MIRIYLILPAALGPEVHLASNRNEYQMHTNKASYGNNISYYFILLYFV
jgi:hypothetical protein